MSYQPLTVTPEQRANLQTLATFLLTQPITDFHMGAFRADLIGADGFGVDNLSLSRVMAEPECGTVGCAVGHGPVAGVTPLPEDKGWWEYARRAFGTRDDATTDYESASWYWLFDASWFETDNTARGAGKRIEIALTKGIPSNHKDQRLGRAPREYSL